MRLALLAMLAALPASAQRIWLSAPPPPAPGITSVAALGTCDATEAGTVVWLSPSNELRDCDGSTWRTVYTSREGVLPNASTDVPGASFIAQASTGYAFRSTNNVPWDFGNGANDEIVSTGSALRTAGSFIVSGGQSLTTDILANTTANTGISVSVPGARYFRLIPNTAATCTSGASGGLQSNSADGNRLYLCNGTVTLPLARMLTGSATVDPPSVDHHTCTTLSLTITGALTSDYPLVRAAAALSSGLILTNPRVSDADTVTAELCNTTAGSAVDQPSVTFNVALVR